MNKKVNKRKKFGFTLIELVISLAIMAVIALIAIPNFNSIKENSKIKADRQSAESIKRTVQLLIVDDTLKLGSTGETELYYNASLKTFDKNSDLVGLDELKEALSHVNPPATKKDAEYLVNIKDDGDEVVVKVNGVPETSTANTN
ncbi:type II secretion system protein [Clostridium tarantellae]|uniref:Prepilin-type N-terminal cleavage/methylation domain-containing protein n=1 Tax=Clostridium tarantellae TaxID=39493 RepID=A0A6I1MMN2_9CLOT|nr:type II secretion system protein [Clostridium tarantellae]MPQ43718.1 prepilin-type N-terminal cleavage/methylation domain-containing protein [Clostridium tarantellae]